MRTATWGAGEEAGGVNRPLGRCDSPTTADKAETRATVWGGKEGLAHGDLVSPTDRPEGRRDIGER